MKNVKTTLAVLMLSGLLTTAFTSCKSEPKNEEHNTEMHAEEHMTNDHMGDQQNEESADQELAFNDDATATVFAAYIGLKDALVATDAEKAAAAAATLAQTAGDNEPLATAANEIAQSTDVEAQRKAFVAVTDQMAAMLEGALSSGEVYKQYCPMAFNNTGASWISADKEIMNPYFGDKMLHCGAVKETIK